MAAQKTEETIVFLPWTVEPQPQTQAVILQQPSETYLRLDATTDKTAISSFALSVIIALILGGLATWLAYWYGRKSFKLTEMSFKVVSQDIKEAAQTHRDTTISLIESQQKIKLMEIEESRNLQIIHELCAIENCMNNIQIVLKTASDKGGLQSLSKEDAANTLQAMNSLRIHTINITHFVKAYKDKDLKQDSSTVHEKIHTILLMLNNEGQKDTELSNLINLTNAFVSTIHNLLKQKAA